ncbi:MAG: O-antigen ligase family protein [Microbacteriaceae bacterium]
MERGQYQAASLGNPNHLGTTNTNTYLAASTLPAHKPSQAPLIVGTVVVSFLLLTSRWGSHIGVSSVYLTDVLLALAIANMVFGRMLFPRPSATANSRISWFQFGVVLFLGWCSYILISGELSATAFRDAAPYFYAVLGAVAYADVNIASLDSVRRTTRWIIIALSLHTAWILLTRIWPDVVTQMPQVGDLAIFSIRGDYDPLLVGLLGTIALWGALNAHSISSMARFGTGVGAAICFLTLLSFGNRGALLGTLFAVGFVLLGYIISSFRSGKTNRVLIAGLVPFVVAGIIVLLPLTPSGARLAATFGIDLGATSEYGDQAVGTSSARANAWPEVLDYVLSDSDRTLQGVGFGPHFMLDSGAAELLVGSETEHQEETRSPHNFWLGTFARTGIIGLGILGALVVTLIFTALRRVTTFTSRVETTVPAVLALGILPPATVGVILESPFGALPFWWATGVFLSLLARGDLFPDQGTAPTEPLVSEAAG